MSMTSESPSCPPPPPPPVFSTIPQARVLPQQQTPQPRSQLKHIPWNKIPANKVVRSDNLWTEVGRQFGDYKVNYDVIENLFAVNNLTSQDGGQDGVDVVDGRKKPTELQLLDNKRSMNVNIFLRQFPASLGHSDVIRMLSTGNSQQLGVDRLRFLQRILPDADEMKLLRQHAGCDRLALAESFLCQLIAIPHVESLVGALLIKEEFHATLDNIKPALDAIILSARDIKQSNALHELIYAVLITGNFLNSGYYGGDAAGIQLASLLKLTEIRSNRPGMNLMHYVAQEVAEKNSNLISELRELKYLQEAANYPLAVLTSEVKQLEGQVKNAYEYIVQTDVSFQQRMKPFLELAREELIQLASDLAEIEELRVDLAVYFCEDVITFNLDECLKTFNIFCQKFLIAAEENRAREIQEEKAKQRRQQTAPGNSDDVISSPRTNITNKTLQVPEIRAPVSASSSTSNRLSSCTTDSQSDELETLLRGSTLGAGGGSFRRSRSRASARLSTEAAFDRERATSPQIPPSPANCVTDDVEQMTSADDLPHTAVTLLRRGSSVRSSCPSRVDSAKGRTRPRPLIQQQDVTHGRDEDARDDVQEDDGAKKKVTSSKSEPRSERNGEYDLAGSSINLLGPCAKLLSLCDNEQLTSPQSPQKSDTGSGIISTSGLQEARTSDYLHRQALDRKHKFKRLSELYSNTEDDDHTGSRPSRSSIISTSGSERNDTEATVDRKQMTSDAGDVRSPSDTSNYEDEGFESDYAASQRSSTISQLSDQSMVQQTGSSTPQSKTLSHAALRQSDTTHTKRTVTRKPTAPRQPQKLQLQQQQQKVSRPTKTACALSRGILDRLMAATESSTRRSGCSGSSAKSLDTSLADPARAVRPARPNGSAVASGIGAGGRSNNVRSHSQPPTSKTAALSLAADTEQHKQRPISGTDGATTAATLSMRRGISTPDETSQRKPREKSATPSVFERLSAGRSSGRDSQTPRLTTPGGTGSSRQTTSTFVRSGTGRASMPSKMTSSTLKVEGDIAGRGFYPSTRSRTGSSDRVLDDNSSMSTKSGGLRKKSTERQGHQGNQGVQGVQGPTLAVDIPLNDQSIPVRPARPGRLSGVSQGDVMSKRTVPVSPGSVTSDKSRIGGAAVQSTNKQRQDRQKPIADSQTRQEFFV